MCRKADRHGSAELCSGAERAAETAQDSTMANVEAGGPVRERAIDFLLATEKAEAIALIGDVTRGVEGWEGFLETPIDLLSPAGQRLVTKAAFAYAEAEGRIAASEYHE